MYEGLGVYWGLLGFRGLWGFRVLLYARDPKPETLEF